MKVIVLSCMHGRQKTVKYCLDKMPFIDKVMIYTTEQDGNFLESTDVIAKAQFRNDPLSFKWNAAIMTLEQLDFDYVILLGSDDYVDENFIQFVKDNVEGYDMLGFKDMYFKQNEVLYYWEGYQNQRKGEPCGAGKVYSKKFLERIHYNLFDEAKQRGLDGVSWRKVNRSNAKIKVESVRKNDLILCDVKDGEGLTPLGTISNLFPVG